MDFLEFIKARKSIRHFSAEVPSHKVIMECLEAASWAPNPTSQQPWKFIVLTGEALKTVCRTITENFIAAKKAERSAPVVSSQTAQIFKERKERFFNEMVSFLNEQGVDLQAAGSGNFSFHHAPIGIMFATYPCKDYNFLKAAVAAMENFMLAATARGLGTCWMNAVSICQDYIKEALNLPEEMILVDGIAVGYPVSDSALNRIPRRRFPIEKVTEWRA